MQQIPVSKTLDVDVVEHELAELWKDTAGTSDEEAAVLRARVANLLVFVSTAHVLDEVDSLMSDITMAHPSRALIMLGEDEATDQDIEMFVDSVCQTDKRTGAKRLCGEVVVLKARGKFTVELPSAALPLLVSDLTTFLWWRRKIKVSDKTLGSLLEATNRLVIDSDEFADPADELIETNNLFDQQIFKHVGVSDLNWARLTLWRGLLADFYDIPTNRPFLDEIHYVRIDYVAPGKKADAIAPQALLLAGWLAHCLGWSISDTHTKKEGVSSFTFSRHMDQTHGGAEASEVDTIMVELNRVERGERTAGRLVEVELRTGGKRPAIFSVSRSENNVHIMAESRIRNAVERGRVLPVRNRSLAQLVSREMEILTNDHLYQQVLMLVTTMINPSAPTSA